MSDTDTELLIIGGGPAGIAAGVYASRKRLNTTFLTKEWGGQSKVSEDIQNWVGTVSLSGAEFTQELKNHLTTYAGDTVSIRDGVCVQSLKKEDGIFHAALDDGSTVRGRAALIATGSHRRKLEVSGADEYEHKGLTYCASCDGPLFAGQDVAVIGGGNAGFETAAQLLAYAKSVTLLHHGDAFKADPITVKKVCAHEHMRALTNAQTTAITGETLVQGLTYTDLRTNETHSLAVSGVFVEIGMVPNTALVADILSLDQYGRIPIDPWTQQTELAGLWAAGDCTNILYHQNNISAGDGVRALEDIYVTLRAK